MSHLTSIDDVNCNKCIDINNNDDDCIRSKYFENCIPLFDLYYK